MTDKFKRRWYQFSLKALLSVMLLVSVALTWLAYERDEVRKRDAVIVSIESRGGVVEFSRSQLFRPAWLRPLLGKSSVNDGEVVSVVYVNVTASDDDLAHVADLPELERLWADNTKVTDAGLVHLAELKNLKWIGLTSTRVTDAGLAQIAGLTRLEQLDLSHTAVTDAGLVHLQGLAGLRELSLDSNQVTDAGLNHLSRLTKLKRLSLDSTQVTDEGAAKLQKTLPNLEIVR